MRTVTLVLGTVTLVLGTVTLVLGSQFLYSVRVSSVLLAGYLISW